MDRALCGLERTGFEHTIFVSDNSIVLLVFRLVLCFTDAGGRLWVLVFPKTVTVLPTAGQAGPIPFKMRGGRKAGVCRWSGIYAGAWAGAGTGVFDARERFESDFRSWWFLFGPAFLSRQDLLLRICFGSVHALRGLDGGFVLSTETNQGTYVPCRLSALRERVLGKLAAATQRNVTIFIPPSPLLWSARRVFVDLQNPSRIVEMAVSCLRRAGAAVVLLPTPNAPPRAGAAAAVGARPAPSALLTDFDRRQQMGVATVPEGGGGGSSRDQDGESSRQV